LRVKQEFLACTRRKGERGSEFELPIDEFIDGPLWSKLDFPPQENTRWGKIILQENVRELVMRKPQDITIDRALLINLLQLAEPYGFMSDVKFQQLIFLSELQMLGKGLRGWHFEFIRFAYGAFSKDVDNDLLFLRRKERLENFSVTDQSQSVLQLLDQVSKETESNQQVMEILQAVINMYGPQDNSDIMKSVEAIEISPASTPRLAQ